MKRMREQRYNRLCLVTAVDIEFKTMVGLLADAVKVELAGIDACRGQWAGRPVVILRCEMGAPDFGPKLVRYLTAASHDAVIMIGLAGGLSSTLRVGDAVLYDRCLDARGREMSSGREEIASIASDDQLTARLAQVFRLGNWRCQTGSGVTASRIATTAAEKKRLANAYVDALAVDLESYEVLQACAQAGVPAAVARVISDAAGDSIPDFNRAYTAAGRVRPMALAAVMVARPAAMMRLLANLGGIKAALRWCGKTVLEAMNRV